MNVSRRSAALALGSTLAGLALPTFAQTSSLASLKLLTSPDDDATPVLYGIQKGLFRSAGLDVTVTPSSSGAAVSVAVVGGSADLGKSSLLSLIAAHARGLPLVIVAPAANYVAPERISGLVVAVSSSIRSGADLVGKTIAVPALNDLAEVSTKAWLDQTGGNAASVKFIEVPSAAAAAALENGRIDAGTLIDPALSTAVAAGKVRILANPLESIAKHFLFSAWFADADRVSQHPDPYARFARVLRAASAYANSHPAETAPILASFTGDDPAVIAKMTRANYATTLAPAELQPLINAAARYGVISSPYDGRTLLATLSS